MFTTKEWIYNIIWHWCAKDSLYGPRIWIREECSSERAKMLVDYVYETYGKWVQKDFKKRKSQKNIIRKLRRDRNIIITENPYSGESFDIRLNTNPNLM